MWRALTSSFPSVIQKLLTSGLSMVCGREGGTYDAFRMNSLKRVTYSRRQSSTSPSWNGHPHTHNRRTPLLLGWEVRWRGALTGDHDLVSTPVVHHVYVCDTKMCHWSTLWGMSESWFVLSGGGRRRWCRQVWYSLGPTLHLPLLLRL